MKKGLYVVIALLSLFVTQSVDATSGYTIAADGSFTGWSDVPKTSYPVQTNKENGTGQVAMLRDDNYLYLYTSLDPNRQGNKYRLDASTWTITSGNSSVTLTVQFNKTPSQGQAAQVVSITSKANGQDKDNLFYTQTIAGAKGVSATEQSKGAFFDQAEIKIPIQSLLKQPSIVKTLTIGNTSMNSPNVTVSGGDTGPWIIASSGLVLVFGLVYYQSRKGKQA